MVSDQSAVDLFIQVMGRSLTLLIVRKRIAHININFIYFSFDFPPKKFMPIIPSWHSQKTMEERVSINHDAISLFLCLCFCTKYRQLMRDRSGVAAIGPTLDKYYWDTLDHLLWARLEAVMVAHNESVRQLDVRKMPVDTRPHYVSILCPIFINHSHFQVVRRYAELTCSLLVCSDLAYKRTEPRLQVIIIFSCTYPIFDNKNLNYRKSLDGNRARSKACSIDWPPN
jgi:hypothetical protein